MQNWFRCSLLALLMLTLLGTTAAAEESSLPTLRPTARARFELALAVNGQAYVVGQGEVIAPSRLHYVLRLLPLDDEPAQTLEVVIYDGRFYIRENDSDEWYVERYSGAVLDPTNELAVAAAGQGAITHVGSVTIAEEPTDQYQIFAGDRAAAQPPFTVYDLWVGQTLRHLHQAQISEYERGRDGSLIRAETISRSYAFDDPTIEIQRPVGPNIPPPSGPVSWLGMPRADLFQTLGSPLQTARGALARQR